MNKADLVEVLRSRNAGLADQAMRLIGDGVVDREGVAGLVRQTPGSIGYVELAYAKQNHLAYASVRNAAGKFIEPTLASTTAAAQGAAAMLAKDVRTPIANSSSPDAYPIAGMTFLLVYKDQKDAEKGKALADFIRGLLRFQIEIDNILHDRQPN
jgi:phosphate transport system substrate-binding protein